MIKSKARLYLGHHFLDSHLSFCVCVQRPGQYSVSFPITLHLIFCDSLSLNPETSVIWLGWLASEPPGILLSSPPSPVLDHTGALLHPAFMQVHFTDWAIALAPHLNIFSLRFHQYNLKKISHIPQKGKNGQLWENYFFLIEVTPTLKYHFMALVLTWKLWDIPFFSKGNSNATWYSLWQKNETRLTRWLTK